MAEATEPQPTATTAPEAEPQPTASPEPPAVQASIPDFEVVDMATGETVSLANYRTDGRPVLLWFWSPH